MALPTFHIKYPAERVGKHRQKDWRAKQLNIEYVQWVSMRGFPAMLDGEDEGQCCNFAGVV